LHAQPEPADVNPANTPSRQQAEAFRVKTGHSFRSIRRAIVDNSGTQADSPGPVRSWPVIIPPRPPAEKRTYGRGHTRRSPS
jgi:hypothetical protein